MTKIMTMVTVIILITYGPASCRSPEPAFCHTVNQANLRRHHDALVGVTIGSSDRLLLQHDIGHQGMQKQQQKGVKTWVKR